MKLLRLTPLLVEVWVALVAVGLYITPLLVEVWVALVAVGLYILDR